MSRAAGLALGLALLCAAAANAHELHPAYLELRAAGGDRWSVLWKVPAREDLRLSISPRFDPRCTRRGEVVTVRMGDHWVDRWTVECPGGLAGTPVLVEGLSRTLTDALVRVVAADGTVQTARLLPESPGFTVAERAPRGQVARTYLRLGVEHILGGVDHLLFVLALLILVREPRRVVATVTAFTVAHSITLALATLGLAQVPQAAVEAVIALSIVFVAMEILRARSGRSDLAQRSPWLVAFAFGLLHGFGFAGALREAGLPQEAIPLALFFFNVGVELGQLAFIAAVLGLSRLVGRRIAALPSWTRALPAYAIGSVAMAWVIDRVLRFWT
jgi:hydrogenase/urease accessory protein HupE